MKETRKITNKSTFIFKNNSISKRVKRTILALNQETLINFMGDDQKFAHLPF